MTNIIFKSDIWSPMQQTFFSILMTSMLLTIVDVEKRILKCAESLTVGHSRILSITFKQYLRAFCFEPAVNFSAETSAGR